MDKEISGRYHRRFSWAHQIATRLHPDLRQQMDKLEYELEIEYEFRDNDEWQQWRNVVIMEKAPAYFKALMHIVTAVENIRLDYYPVRKDITGKEIDRLINDRLISRNESIPEYVVSLPDGVQMGEIGDWIGDYLQDATFKIWQLEGCPDAPDEGDVI